MKPSQNLESLLTKVYEKPTLFPQLFGKSGWNLEVLKQIESCGEPAAIPYITPILITGTSDEIVIGAKIIKTLLTKIAPEDLVRLDEHMRSSWFFALPNHNDWLNLNTREIAKRAMCDGTGSLLSKLCSFHPSGYIREDSVKRLQLTRDGSELPFLFLRLNDWVSNVRDSAYKAILSRINISYVDYFVKNLALVVRLERLGRVTHGHIIELVTELLSAPHARPSLVSGMLAESTTISRASFRFLTAGNPKDMPDTLLQALNLKDSVIRLWATRLIGSVLSVNQLAMTLQKVLHDYFAPIRLEALRIWVKTFPAQAQDILLAALLDSSCSIRDEARFHLRQTSNIDLVAFYRNTLITDNSKLLVTALSGLAEVGRPSDAECIRPYLAHRLAKVRRKAIQGIIRLGGEEYIQLAFNMISDHAPSVSTGARRLLEPFVATIGASILWHLFQNIATQNTRKNVLHLIAALPKWERISYLILAINHENKEIAKLASSFLERWLLKYNQNQATPSPDQILRVEAALNQSTEALSNSTVTSIRFALNTFKKT